MGKHWHHVLNRFVFQALDVSFADVIFWAGLLPHARGGTYIHVLSSSSKPMKMQP